MKKAGQKPELFHRTFQMPKRREELLGGGSMYWVIKGIVQARQKLLDLREGFQPVSDVRDAVSKIRSELPDGIDEPQVTRIDAEGGRRRPGFTNVANDSPD